MIYNYINHALKLPLTSTRSIAIFGAIDDRHDFVYHCVEKMKLYIRCVFLFCVNRNTHNTRVHVHRLTHDKRSQSHYKCNVITETKHDPSKQYYYRKMSVTLKKTINKAS